MHEPENWEHGPPCHHGPPFGPKPGFGLHPPFGPHAWWTPKLYVKGLLHLAILKLLKQQSLHGGEVQRLLKEKYGVDVSSPAVYGALRKLEAFGFVVATWDTSGPGPARRMYKITEEGAAYLDASIERLGKLKDLIEKLITTD